MPTRERRTKDARKKRQNDEFTENFSENKSQKPEAILSDDQIISSALNQQDNLIDGWQDEQSKMSSARNQALPNQSEITKKQGESRISKNRKNNEVNKFKIP